MGILYDNSKMITAGCLITVSGVAAGVWWYIKFLKNKMPSNWMKVGEVSELCIYPVKSFKAIKPVSFRCSPFGPILGVMRDRIFAVLDENGIVVSGRIYPQMTQMTCKVTGSTISLFCPDHPDKFDISINNIDGVLVRFKIWGVPTEGIDCGDEAAAWISKSILKESSGLRLVYCLSQKKAKPVNFKITEVARLSNIPVMKQDGGFFSDAFSYHLISEISVKELNSRLDGENVSPLNFRPNIVIKGKILIPFEEDSWKWVKIGETVFQNVAPCTRCIFTTVDTNTGVKSKKMEPLNSLRQYRNIRDPAKKQLLTSPAMGIYLGFREGEKISVGDEVFIPV